MSTLDPDRKRVILDGIPDSTPEQQAAATRAIRRLVSDSDDARELLNILGLNAA